jgi:hypothetical protein
VLRRSDSISGDRCSGSQLSACQHGFPDNRQPHHCFLVSSASHCHHPTANNRPTTSYHQPPPTTARPDPGLDLAPTLLPTLPRHYFTLELPTNGARGPAVILDWNKTSSWSPQSLGHRHPTVQQFTTTVPPSLRVDKLTEALAHLAHYTIFWGTTAIHLYHSTAYRVLSQLQLRLSHPFPHGAGTYLHRMLCRLSICTVQRCMGTSPLSSHSSFWHHRCLSGTTRGISWCRLRLRNLHQLQRDPTIVVKRANTGRLPQRKDTLLNEKALLHRPKS